MQTLRNILPVVTALGVVQISSFIDLQIASYLPQGAATNMSYANTLAMLTVSLFGVSVAAAALPMFARHFRDMGLSGEGTVVVSADAGRAKLATRFAEMLDADVAIIAKLRPEHGKARVAAIIGDVAGKKAIISDDIIDTAGTLCAGAEAVHQAGATQVVACATHAILSEPALQRIKDSVLHEVVVCDTVPIHPSAVDSRIRVLPVDAILAQTIEEVFREGSVSNLFDGENQLF